MHSFPVIGLFFLAHIICRPVYKQNRGIEDSVIISTFFKILFFLPMRFVFLSLWAVYWHLSEKKKGFVFIFKVLADSGLRRVYYMKHT